MPPTQFPFFVHVIESPSNFDLLDGRTEGRILLEALRLGDIPVWYNLVTDRETFYAALADRLSEAVKQIGKPPTIHLSVHGNEHGIALTNGEFINWSELRQALLPINHAIQSALLVCISSCFGSSGCRMAMYESQPLPFFAIVGHDEKAFWSDAAIGFTTFYHHLTKGANFEDAVHAMRIASGDHRFSFHLGQSVQQDWSTYLANIQLQQLQDELHQTRPQPPPSS